MWQVHLTTPTTLKQSQFQLESAHSESPKGFPSIISIGWKTFGGFIFFSFFLCVMINQKLMEAYHYMRKARRNNSVLLILLVISLFLNVFLFAKLIAKNKGSSNKSSIKDYVGLWECVEWKTHYLEIKKDGSVFLIDYRKDESQKQFIIKAYAGIIKDTTIVFDGEYANPKKTQNGYAFDDNFIDHFSSVEDLSFTRGNAVVFASKVEPVCCKLYRISACSRDYSNCISSCKG